jgi:hypothetical protein
MVVPLTEPDNCVGSGPRFVFVCICRKVLTSATVTQPVGGGCDGAQAINPMPEPVKQVGSLGGQGELVTFTSYTFSGRRYEFKLVGARDEGFWGCE